MWPPLWGLLLIMIFRACLIAAMAAPLLAAAQAPAEAQDNTVAGVVVGGGEAPSMAASFPANDSEVQPGVLVLKIVFDQPMKPDAFAVSSLADAPAPDCLQVPRQLDDRKTFVLLCSTDGGKRYGLGINAPGDGGFVSEGERRAAPSELRFSTAQGAPVRTVRAAMKAAGLGELDLPVDAIALKGASVPLSGEP